MKCPMCEEQVDLSKTECPNCGVIYVKAFAKIAENKELAKGPKDKIHDEEHPLEERKSWTNKFSPIRVGIPIILIVLLISGLVFKFSKSTNATLSKISSDTAKSTTEKSSSAAATSKVNSYPKVPLNDNSWVKELDILSETTKGKLSACSECVSGDYEMVKDQDGHVYVTKLGDCITLCETAIEFHGKLDEEIGKIFKLPTKKEFELFAENHRNTFEKAQNTSSDGMIVSLNMGTLVKMISVFFNNKYMEEALGAGGKPGNEKMQKYILQVEDLHNLSDKLLEQKSRFNKQNLKDLEAMK